MLYACDDSWWHGPSGSRALREFGGEKYCSTAGGPVTVIPHRSGVGIGDGFVYTGGGNSGFQAVNLALQWGAEVILVGFDMRIVDGRKHWHPDHKGSNPMADQLVEWARCFDQLARVVGDRIKVHGPSAIREYARTPLIPACEGVLGVFRSGGWVTPGYAEKLSKAITGRSTRFLCLTDGEPDCERLPLQHNWPGWWSKMECFRPDLRGDWLYLDMDTVIYGDLDPYKVGRPAMLGDFYRPILESGMMYLTEPMRRRVWERWISDPARWMAEYHGDGPFIRDTVGHLCMDLRTVGGIHSYKVHGKQDDTRALVFHGDPRPHQTRHWND